MGCTLRQSSLGPHKSCFHSNYDWPNLDWSNPGSQTLNSPSFVVAVWGIQTPNFAPWDYSQSSLSPPFESHSSSWHSGVPTSPCTVILLAHYGSEWRHALWFPSFSYSYFYLWSLIVWIDSSLVALSFDFHPLQMSSFSEIMEGRDCVCSWSVWLSRILG